MYPQAWAAIVWQDQPFQSMVSCNHHLTCSCPEMCATLHEAQAARVLIEYVVSTVCYE
jgi:hypothetical protein